MKKLLIIVSFILLVSGCSPATTEVIDEKTEKVTDAKETATDASEEVKETATDETVDEATDETTDEPIDDVKEAVEESSDMVYDATSLAEFNGLDGNRAYIAIEGIVYDVTDNLMWSAGLHQGRYQAGQDLTEEMKKAPHGLTKLKTVEVVGTYKEN